MAAPLTQSALHKLQASISQIERLDDQNQARFRAGPGRPKRLELTSIQFYLLTEGLFLHLFRSYEGFIERCFLAHMMAGRSDRRIGSYVVPNDIEHARNLVKGASRFVEWHSPDNVIERAELYFRQGGIIKPVIASNRVLLQEMKRLRDRIAHASPEAETQYRKVVQARLLTVPRQIPTPGQFLQSSVRNQASVYHLRLYLSEIMRISNDIAA